MSSFYVIMSFDGDSFHRVRRTQMSAIAGNLSQSRATNSYRFFCEGTRISTSAPSTFNKDFLVWDF